MDVGNSFRNATDNFFAFLPNLLGFLILLLIGYVVAKLVQGLLRKILDKAGLDRHLHESSAHQYVERVLPGASPSNGIARVAFWLVFAFFIVAAIGALKIAAVTDFMNQVLAYLPNVIVAIVIFVVAAAIAGAVAGGVAKVMGDTPTGKIVATVVPALVMVIAMFMILNQLKIAEEIVTIAFAAIMFAIALGLALAFGLGGRDVAARLLEDAHSKGREAKEQAKQDARTGKDRAQEHMPGQSSGYDTGAGATPYTTTGGEYGTTTGGTYGATGATGGAHAGDPGGYVDPNQTQPFTPPER
jgi:hypothetical protein